MRGNTWKYFLNIYCMCLVFIYALYIYIYIYIYIHTVHTYYYVNKTFIWMCLIAKCYFK